MEIKNETKVKEAYEWVFADREVWIGALRDGYLLGREPAPGHPCLCDATHRQRLRWAYKAQNGGGVERAEDLSLDSIRRKSIKQKERN